MNTLCVFFSYFFSSLSATYIYYLSFRVHSCELTKEKKTLPMYCSMPRIAARRLSTSSSLRMARATCVFGLLLVSFSFYLPSLLPFFPFGTCYVRSICVYMLFIMCGKVIGLLDVGACSHIHLHTKQASFSFYI